jgi:hypothetical protein
MFLTEARHPNGAYIDLETFDIAGARTLMDLFHEVRSRDVFLLYNPVTGRAGRYAQNVTVLITNIVMGLVWLETQREYPNGVVIKKWQYFTIRETRLPGESALEAVTRGLRQELGYFPLESEVIIWGFADEISRHESTVYPGILSIVTTQQCEIRSEMFYRRDGHVIKDYSDDRKVIEFREDGPESKDDESDAKDDGWVKTIIRSFPTT